MHHNRQSHLRLPPHTNNIQIHPAPASALPGQTPTQQQQQQHIRMPPQVAVAAAVATPQQTQHVIPQSQSQSMPNASNAHMRDQPQNRSNYHKHMPATQTQHNQTAQMQKIRQQHQHLSHVPRHHQQQQQTTQQQPHIAGLQQTMQRNVPNTHYHQQHTTQQQQYNTLPVYTARPTNQQQQYGYNYASNKSNISNTTQSSTNFSTPRTILQNPNRTKQPITPKTISVCTVVPTTPATTLTEINEEVVEASCSKNNTEKTVVNVTTKKADNASSSQEVQNTEKQVLLEKVVENTENNKENLTESVECSHNTENTALCNNDDSIAKNGKEKTPMCLVNELARFNKIEHQYRLTGENGPAHSKKFTVTLKLGSEEYTADGFKIKKAQHAAAALALEKTAYKHPTPKAIRNHDDSKPRPYIMPTVELNALAMKLGQTTCYLFDPRQNPPLDTAADMHEVSLQTHYGGPRALMAPPPHSSSHMMSLPPQSRMLAEVVPTYGPRRPFDGGGYCPTIPPTQLPPSHMSACSTPRPYGGPRQRGGGGYSMMQRYPRYQMIQQQPPAGITHHMHPYGGLPVTPYKITLVIGKDKFVGTGRTVQQAKHDAASRALQVLRNQLPENPKEDVDDTTMDENDFKSPISQVHEAAIKRNLTVHFKIIREEGPAHMRNFITACIMGTMVTEGEGHGKKISKKRAAEKMLLQLKSLPPVNTPSKSTPKRLKTKTPGKNEAKKKTAEVTDVICSTTRRGKREKVASKEKSKVSENEEETPVTKLLQLMQLHKQKEPVFEYITKSGNENLRRREHIMEVSALGRVARGTAVSKKLAKQKAAENLLEILEKDFSSADSLNETTDGQVKINTKTNEHEDSHNQSLLETVQEKTIAKSAVKPTTIDVLDVPIVETSAGHVPGIVILRQNKKPPSKKKETTEVTTTTPSRPIKAIAKRIELPTTSTKATSSSGETSEAVKPTKPETQKIVELAASSSTRTSTADSNNSTESTTTAAIKIDVKPTSSSTSTSAPPMMKHQLLYLAKLLGFEVSFSDFPKGNHNEFLSIVSLSTDPPQMCHGCGPSTDESQNDAARNALKILSDLGLNN